MNAEVLTRDKRLKYANIPMSYDCEASSFVDLSGKEVGLVYSWAMGMFLDRETHYIVLGRYAEEAAELMLEASDVFRCCSAKGAVYVHNLQYDISFLYKLIPFDKMFLVKSRKVLYAKLGNLYLKDSLLLSGGRSLNTIGNNLLKYKARKLVGDLDYELVRSPETPLSDNELKYQVNDVVVLNCYIQEKIEQDGTLGKVPSTNTGYVRRALRDSCFEHYERYANMLDRLVLPPSAYWVLKQCFRGGYTHGAQHHVGVLLHDVGSYDIKSSYPAVILTEYFPMSEPKQVELSWVNQPGNFEKLCDKYCVTAILKIKDVCTKHGYEYTLSESGMVSRLRDIMEHKKEIESMNMQSFNGRVIVADWIRIGFTERDWEDFKLFYEYTSYEVEECWIYERGKLPKQIVVPMLEWFQKKTVLDGVKDAKIEYMIAKNMLNAIAGCMEMDPVRDIYEYDCENREFLAKQVPDLVEAVLKNNTDKNRFLYYPWGVYILAHARHRLLQVVAHTGPDHVYSDTDSEKLLHYEKYEDYFRELNERTIEKLKEAGKYYNVSDDILMPRKPNGKVALLGVFEFEGVYKRFITHGAKRYLVENYPEKGKDYTTYQLTVAGLNKRLGCEWLCGCELDHLNEKNERVLKSRSRDTYSEKDRIEIGSHTATRDPFDYFNVDMKVPPEYAGRLTMKYIDEKRTGVGVDYLGNVFNYTSHSGVYSRKTGYEMGAVSGSEEEGMNLLTMLLSNGITEEGEA